MHGEEVIFLEKPIYLEDLRRNGLSLEIQGKIHSLQDIQVVDSLDDALMIGPYDAAIFAVKSFDTKKAVEEIKPYRVALPPFICLQNGVENEALLATVIGKENVIAGTVTSAVARKNPGQITLERLRGVGISSHHVLSERILASFKQAGLQPKLYNRPDSMKWSKMLTNILANASSAILDLTPQEVYRHPELYRLELRMIEEILQVMKALNIPVTALPGTPVNWLVWVARNLPSWASQPILQKALGGGRGGKMPSFHIDLYAGRKQSEVEFLNGAIVRAGERMGIETPVNRVLTETLVAMAKGSVDKKNFVGQPEKLLALIPEDERRKV